MKLTISEEERQEIEQGLKLQRKALEKNKKSNEDLGNFAGVREAERRLDVINGGPGTELGVLEKVYREGGDQGPLFGAKDGDGVSVREGQSVDEALDDPDFKKAELVEADEEYARKVGESYGREIEEEAVEEEAEASSAAWDELMADDESNPAPEIKGGGEDLGAHLATRTVNALAENAGIRTVGDLMARAEAGTIGSLRAVNGIGPKAIEEIRALVAAIREANAQTDLLDGASDSSTEKEEAEVVVATDGGSDTVPAIVDEISRALFDCVKDLPEAALKRGVRLGADTDDEQLLDELGAHWWGWQEEKPEDLEVDELVEGDHVHRNAAGELVLCFILADPATGRASFHYGYDPDHADGFDPMDRKLFPPTLADDELLARIVLLLAAAPSAAKGGSGAQAPATSDEEQAVVPPRDHRANPNPEVLAAVEATLKKFRDAGTEELRFVAGQVDESVYRLTRRQFIAAYPTRVKRRWGGSRAQAPNDVEKPETEAEAEEPTGPMYRKKCVSCGTEGTHPASQKQCPDCKALMITTGPAVEETASA